VSTKAFSTILVQHTLSKFLDTRAFWRSGLSATVPECQKIKNVGRTSMYTGKPQI